MRPAIGCILKGVERIISQVIVQADEFTASHFVAKELFKSLPKMIFIVIDRS